MKTLTEKIVIAAAAVAACAALAACSEEIIGPDAPGELYRITAGLATGQETRTCIDPSTYGDSNSIGVLWHPGDSIGVYGKSTKNAMFVNTARYNSSKTTFEGKLAPGDKPVIAYYPYSDTNAGRDYGSLLGTVPAEQPFCSETGRLTGDWKVGKEVAPDDYEFINIFSLIRIDISAATTALSGQPLDYVEFTVESPTAEARAITGDFTFSGATGAYTAPTNTGNRIKMTWTDTPALTAGGTLTGFVSAIPDIHKGDVLTFTVASDEKAATFTVTSQVDFEPGCVYLFPLTLSNFASETYKWSVRNRPKLRSLQFTAASNAGKILDKQLTVNNYKTSVSNSTGVSAEVGVGKATVSVPYLYDFSLVPTLSVTDGTTVTADGAAIESGKSTVDFSKPVKLQLTGNGETREYTVEVTNSGVPVVVINQSGSGTKSKDFIDLKVRAKETDWVKDDQITIYNADGTVNVAAAACGVRLRGNTTQKYPKLPFAIKLNKKASVLGMPAHKRWVLLANYLDHSGLRNLAGLSVARAVQNLFTGDDSGIPWNVSGQNVELVIDGRHVGTYTLAEQIKIDKSRLNIHDCYADRVEDGLDASIANCGFLMEFDTNYDESYKFMTTRGVPVMLKDDANTLPDEMWTTLRNRIQAMENNLRSGNYDEAMKELNINSIIDQWLIYEMTFAREFGNPRSVYYFIDGTGPISAGPVWDFDRGTFFNPERAVALGNTNSNNEGHDYYKNMNKFMIEKSKVKENISKPDDNCLTFAWLPLLVKSEKFRARVQQRWAVIYPRMLAIPAEIDRLAALNARAWASNEAIWPTSKDAKNANIGTGLFASKFTDFSGDEDLTDYNAIIENMKTCFLRRLEALNSLITAGNFPTNLQ